MISMKRHIRKFFRMLRRGRILGIRPLKRLRRIMTKYYGVFGSILKPDKWVFIVGSTNSGTTLLHSILARHPKIGSMRLEGLYYTDQFERYRKKVLKSRGEKSGAGKRAWATVPERSRMDENTTGVDVDKLKRQWGGRFNDIKKPVLLEKSPPNAVRVRWLQKHFENAHFIGIIRNGYAVSEGIRRKTRHDIRKAALQWSNANEIMLADFEHLERKKLIRYERLTEKPEEVIGEVCEFIGIEADEILVEGKWRIHRNVSTIKNMNYLSFGRLSNEDYSIIEKVAGDMLKRLSYSRTE